MKRLIAFLGILGLFVCGPCTNPSYGAGLLIAEGGFGGVLEIEEHTVDVTINNGVAVTEVTQVFRNTEDRQVEALYTFPVPKGASVSNFSMWIDGKEMVGEVVEKERARQIYNSYKQVRRDPGLLEQTDYRTFEMRIFPIGPNARQRVQITYCQELNVDHDWGTYVYPLATVSRPGVDPRVSGRFALNLNVKSEIPIEKMESPSHPDDFVFANHAENYVQGSLERRDGDLSRDVVLAYRLKRPRTGIDLIASRQEGEDGYFCLTLTAGEDLESLEAGSDYLFVLDISGSMAHDGKLLLSRNSVAAFIDTLGEDDRFDVITFNVRPNPLFRELNHASKENRNRAVAFLNSQEAKGGTVLDPAIGTAYQYADPDRPLNVVILSDGMTEPQERTVLMSRIRGRPANARVFCVGVGNDVNKPLLEQMAVDSGGLAAFVSRGDDFERQAQAFRRKLTRPVGTDLRITFEGTEVYDVEPEDLPNLYHGSPIRMYGRYRKPGEVNVILEGEVRGRTIRQTALLSFPGEDLSNPEIERMWAWKRVDRLMKQENRKAALDEIIRLGEGFSIVTEYTSFLVLENDAEYRRWNIERKNLLRNARDREALAARKEMLMRIREKAAADLGPQPAEEPTPQVQAQNRPDRTVNPTQQPAPTNRPAPSPTRRRSRGWDFDFGGGNSSGGGGALDPVSGSIALALGAMALATRRRNRKEQ